MNPDYDKNDSGKTVTQIPKSVLPINLVIEDHKYVLYIYENKAFEYSRVNRHAQFYGSWNLHNQELIMSTLSWLLRG